MLDLSDELRMQFAFAFQKDSEFGSLFNYNLTKAIQEGIHHHLETKWMPFEPVEYQVVEDATVLDYDNLIFPFVCLFSGLVLSILGILAEKIVFGILKSYLRHSSAAADTSTHVMMSKM